MTRFLLSCGTVCLTALSSGCGDDTTGASPTTGVSVETDKAEYSLASDSFAVVTLTSLSNQSLHLPLSGYVAYQRLVDGEWSDAFSWFTSDGIGRSFPLLPMASRTDQLELWFYLVGQPGTYRFQYLVYASHRLNAQLPLEERVSAPFVVTP